MKLKARVKCGWCHNYFETLSTRGEDGYVKKICPYCKRTVSSSKIEFTGNTVGKKHFHSDLKNGDVV